VDVSWQVLRIHALFDRPPWLSLWEEDVRLPSGLVIPGYLRMTARDYAMTFALTLDGTVPLVCQYKHGVGQPIYDLPAGYLDSPDEPPLAAAQRELQEETGLVAPHWESLGSLPIDTNRGDTCAHIFLALDAHHAGPPQLDPSEALEVTYHLTGELREMVRRGEIVSLASVAAIMLALDRPL
jgi:8-oxo-dGTP pyrophosphatase MutT (NUDIX family)